jgi:phosphoglycolate phosphatase-like HAD superfamily hydrolase
LNAVPRRVAVFDIDGTLTDTSAVDDECYVRAIEQVLGVDVRGTDWGDAPHVTDAAILEWLCERHCGRSLREGELDHARRVFVENLRSELTARPDRFRPIPGAGDVFARMRSAGWEIAVATGGWETSARLKLQTIGIGHEGLALASASDARTRTEIIELAVARLSNGHASGAPKAGFLREAREFVVSLGDGVWDVRTAAALEVPFIGIGSGERAARLYAAGADTVLEDLSDSARLFAALEGAGVPPR